MASEHVPAPPRFHPHDYRSLRYLPLYSASAKLMEAERWLERFRWACQLLLLPSWDNERELADDTFNVVVLTAEVAREHTVTLASKKLGIAPKEFDDWLRERGVDEGVALRGVRTLRRILAHVEHKPISRVVEYTTAGDPPGAVNYRLMNAFVAPNIPEDQFGRSRRLLHSNEVDAWNVDVGARSADEILQEALSNLGEVVAVIVAKVHAQTQSAQ
jgi:hypothetical protein